jgi:histone-lysine N-methyltransferase SETMAR
VEIFKISQTAVSKQLHNLGYASLLDVCDSHYKRNENDPFFKRIVTGDKNWIVYNHVEQKRSWGRQGERPLSTPKAELHQKKVMLCIWWDWKEILYYNLLPRNQTINSDVYCSQLNRLKAAIDQERPELVNRKGVVFHDDNARPHAVLATREKFMQLGWDVLPHPPYSTDLASSDYHIFRSLQSPLKGRILLPRKPE